MLDKAISMNDRCEKAYFWRGMLNKRVGKAESAYRDFRKAVDLNHAQHRRGARGAPAQHAGRTAGAVEQPSVGVALEPRACEARQERTRSPACSGGSSRSRQARGERSTRGRPLDEVPELPPEGLRGHVSRGGQLGELARVVEIGVA